MQRLIWTVILAMLVSLGGCGGGTRQSTKDDAAACLEMQKALDKAEDAFVTKVKDIRNRHILVVQYDQEMIDALTAYRDRMRAIMDEEEAVAGGHFHCTGKPMADLKLDQAPKFDRVQGYLLTFEKAVREDPKDAYIP